MLKMHILVPFYRNCHSYNSSLNTVVQPISFQTISRNMNLFEKQQNEFSGRHIGPNKAETAAMLLEIGVDSIEELISKTIPDGIRIKTDLDIPPAISEF